MDSLVPPPISLDDDWRLRAGDQPQLLQQIHAGSWVPVQSHADRVAYRVDAEGGTWFVKHYRPVSLRGAVRDFLLRRKPQRAFELGVRLREAGVPTPKPLALFLTGRWVIRRAVLVTEWVPDAVEWRTELSRWGAGGRIKDARRAALARVARLLGQVHRQGYYHGDLVGNLLCADGEDGCHPFIIDLEELDSRLSGRRRVKNLEELARCVMDLRLVTLRERWEFLKVYGAAAGLEEDRCRHLWRRGRTQQLRRLNQYRKRQASSR